MAWKRVRRTAFCQSPAPKRLSTREEDRNRIGSCPATEWWHGFSSLPGLEGMSKGTALSCWIRYESSLPAVCYLQGWTRVNLGCQSWGYTISDIHQFNLFPVAEPSFQGALSSLVDPAFVLLIGRLSLQVLQHGLLNHLFLQPPPQIDVSAVGVKNFPLTLSTPRISHSAEDLSSVLAVSTISLSAPISTEAAIRASQYSSGMPLIRGWGGSGLTMRFGFFPLTFFSCFLRGAMSMVMLWDV